MNIAATVSKNGIIIRLTDERWRHIVLMHPKLGDKQKQVLRTVKDPEGRHLVVVYRELADDGFIITAYDTTDVYWLFRKKLIWSKPL